jgi:hypothetical protein
MHRFVRIVLTLAASVALLGASLDGVPAESPDKQSGQSPNSLAIIVNRSNPVEDLSYAELRRIFLGERSLWPDGRRITLVMMQPGQPERKTVLHEICRMSEADYHKHLLQKLFTGEVIVSPKTLASPPGVRKFIFNVPGAIGYIRASDLDSTVKVLHIDGHLPDDKDYRLQIDARGPR